MYDGLTVVGRPEIGLEVRWEGGGGGMADTVWYECTCTQHVAVFKGGITSTMELNSTGKHAMR